MDKLRVTAVGLTLALGALLATSATAKVYDWSFYDTSGDLVASGSLTTGSAVTVDIPSAQTVLPVLSATGSILGVDGFQAETFSLYGTYTTPLGFDSIPGGSQTYDNAVYVNTPHVDGNGLEFTGNTSGDFFNIYNNVNTGGYTPGNYPQADVLWNNVGTTTNGTFDISAIPEPATWAMMLLGVAMIGAGLRIARRKQRMALAAA
jgi:hypothetical protein